MFDIYQIFNFSNNIAGGQGQGGEDTIIYLVDDLGNYLTDDSGNYLIV